MKKILLLLTLICGIIFSQINTELMYLSFTTSLIILAVATLKPSYYHVYYRERSDWRLASKRKLPGFESQYVGKLKYHELPKSKISIV